MLAPMMDLLRAAQRERYAVGAFNVYNLEGVRAVVAAAEETHSPAILQIHPAALRHGGPPLIALCLAAACEASVPIAVHLDHAAARDDIAAALAVGQVSIMVDGSHLPYEENLAFSREMAVPAHACGVGVEAELGRLSGTEDGLAVAEYEARLTDPRQAAEFVDGTSIDALAICIGNAHGRYTREPRLDLGRLAAIRAAVPVPLVLHGASGLPDAQVARAIAGGICKLNVNTDVREAYVDALRAMTRAAGAPELLDLMAYAIGRMRNVVTAKLQLLGSVERV